jgi:hypothetical protein
MVSIELLLTTVLTDTTPKFRTALLLPDVMHPEAHRSNIALLLRITWMRDMKAFFGLSPN